MKTKLTPHEQMLLTVELLAKRKANKKVLTERDFKNYVADRVYHAVSCRQKRCIY